MNIINNEYNTTCIKSQKVTLREIENKLKELSVVAEKDLIHITSIDIDKIGWREVYVNGDFRFFINDFEIQPINSETNLGYFNIINASWGEYWNNLFGSLYGTTRMLINKTQEAEREWKMAYSEAFLRYWNARQKRFDDAGYKEGFIKIEQIKSAFMATLQKNCDNKNKTEQAQPE